MHCPFCSYADTKVIDSRLIAEGLQTRRRRECPSCGDRFTTFETAELLMPKIIKSRNNMREPFNEQKQVIGSNEVVIAPEEPPAESIKKKRRGWWQRGGLF